ncbi:MAG: ATP-dependent RecD-like DNA helicase [Lachnospiraceae bacterium]|nr:ATP-dependent RecD-like DNA helicase [Lachnospiraceae bacterium]
METIKGYVEKVIFEKEENGYAVLSFVVDEEEITCTGTFGHVDRGEMLELEGEYGEHPVYGMQFQVKHFRSADFDDETSIEMYLASGVIKGIGKAMAARIVKKFGDDTLRIMEEEPERLTEIKGISERIAQSIAEQMEGKKQIRDALMFLQNYGISNKMAIKVYQAYEDRLYDVIRTNPYKLVEDVEGIGFKKADEIARKAGFEEDSQYRIRSGILYALQLAEMEGSLYLPMEEMLGKASELLGVEEEKIRDEIGTLTVERKILVKTLEEEVRVYSARAFYAELGVARMLLDINSALSLNEDQADATRARYEKRLAGIEKDQDLDLDEMQRKAVLEAMYHGVLILSGGPGTGKTTTIHTMIRMFLSEGLDIFLAAPTGRAAKRITETTGYEARTLHRMLEVTGIGNGKFERNEENPLEADVIIVDEMSMVDIYLMQALCKAVAPGTRLILVGDQDQLPSVGPGEVLRDLMKSEGFPTVVLNRIFRQEEGSDICNNAHLINQGKEIELGTKSKDFLFLERNDANVIYKHILELYDGKLARYVHAEDPLDVQVLTPMKKGLLGAEELNRVLQGSLNPPSNKKAEHRFGEDKLFREGDKVMQIHNDYQIPWEVVGKFNIVVDEGTGVFNGDMGVIKKIDNMNKNLIVEFDEHRLVTYPFSQLEELELAYAVTVHKSQGSEYPAVILPLLGGPPVLLTRNLLYTAVTRARGCVVILGDRGTVNRMIENNKENRRYTSLDERVRELSGT